MTEVDYHIDACQGGRFRGWAWSPARPEVALDLVIVDATGAAVARTTADGFRGDLASAGKRGGWCGFALMVPAHCASGLYDLRVQDGDERVRIVEPQPFEASEQPQASATETVLALGDGSGAHGYIEHVGPDAFAGWIHGGTPFAAPLALELVEQGHVLASGLAGDWRTDIEDLFQGDGRVAFRLPFPRTLYDGAIHALDLRRAGASRSLLSAPIAVQLAAAPPPEPEPEPTPARPPAGAPIELSIVVVFHDMRREAARTLASLSRAFQRDIGDLAYEVICIDNGSAQPLDDMFVESHGPEFRLVRPDAPQASPVFALNAAAAQARGRFVAMMIDGAHLLSPGVLAEAIAALRADTHAVVAVRHWFVGGDQRWLSAVGYSRAHEDLLFARIDWPRSGYDIFRISSPIFDSPNTWLDSLSESNCLFLSAEAFAALGGYDEMFSVPGGGFANLDLFARAARAPGATVVALIGEATFHQYHGGTTTNVTDAEKERRVRRYAADFTTGRGYAFEPVHAADIHLRGRIRNDFARNGRQRPNVKVKLGLTTQLRPVDLAYTFEDGARSYARTTYIESGAVRRSIWAGQPTGVAPADLLEIQQMLFATRPQVLILREIEPGLIAFVRSILPAVGLRDLRLIVLARAGDRATPPGAIGIVGDLADPPTRAAIDAAIGTAERVCVLLQPRADEPLPDDVIARHAQLVSADLYLVVLGAAFGQPEIGYSTQWTAGAIRRFIERHPEFVVDTTMNAHLVTTCPAGFLRRLPDTRSDRAYDAALDLLEGV